MEYRKFKTLLRRVIVIPMLVTTSLAAFLLWETFDLNKALAWVDHTDPVLDQSGQLLKLLLNRESAKRGYIATGDEAFLQPYIDGAKRFDSEFQALDQLVADNPAQQKRMKDLYAANQEAEDYDSRVIALRRTGKADPALIDAWMRKGKIDKLRDQIDEFQAVEEALHVQRLEDAHHRSILLIASCLVLCLGSGIFLALFTRYQMQKLGTKLLESEEQQPSAALAKLSLPPTARRESPSSIPSPPPSPDGSRKTPSAAPSAMSSGSSMKFPA